MFFSYITNQINIIRNFQAACIYDFDLKFINGIPDTYDSEYLKKLFELINAYRILVISSANCMSGCWEWHH